MNIDKTGDFAETMISWDSLTKNFYNKNTYTAYLYGDPPLIEINNLNNSQGKHILIIKDSFAGVVNPFLALGLDRLADLQAVMLTGAVGVPGELDQLMRLPTLEVGQQVDLLACEICSGVT